MRLICVTKRLSLFRATSVKFTDHTALYRILDNNGHQLYIYIQLYYHHYHYHPSREREREREERIIHDWNVDTMVMLFFFKG